MAESTLYVFDFDDTLAWASDWYEDIPLDDSGYVAGPGKSPAMRAALGFISEANSDPDLPEYFKGMKLKIHSDLNFGEKYTLYFVLVDSNDNPIARDYLRLFWSEEDIKRANINDLKGLSNQVGVMYDDPYYDKPSTIGDGGTNNEMINLYKQYRNHAVILTARNDYSKLRAAVEEFLIRECGGLPIKIFMRPQGMNGEKFKANVIMHLLDWGYQKIHFYDDNPSYIKAVQSALDDHDRDHGTNLAAIVETTLVSQSNKPFKLVSNRFWKLMKLAGMMELCGKFEVATEIDYELEKLLNKKMSESK